MNEKKVRILSIANMNSDSGVACFLMNYLRAMDTNLLCMDFICWDKREDNFYSEIERMGGTVFLVTSYKENPLHFLSDVKKIVKDGKYDIIHGHEAVMSLPAFYFGKKNHVPVRVAHSHSVEMTSFVKKMAVSICRAAFQRYCTDVMACSQMAGEYLFGSKYFGKKGKILHNAIDVEKYRFNRNIRDKMRKKLKLEDEFIIGHVGRFNQNKNHKFLVEVFASFSEKEKNAKLLLIGDGETKTEIGQLIKKKNLEDKIIFLGIQENVNEWLQVMDAFVFPSFREGLGIVLIEAQSAGLPCYCSNTIPEEARCSKNVKYISLKRSPEFWAETILNQPDENRDHGAEVVKNAGYDIKEESKRLQNFYLTAVERQQ